MNEQTIESTFTSRDWHEAFCAHCIEYGSCVSMADVPTCYRCLEKFYDESGEPIELNVYQPTTQELYDELAPDFSPEALYEKAGRVLGTPKFDQSAAFAEIAEDQAKRIAMKNLAVQIVMLALGFLGGYLVTITAR